jgi:hypothetical protein
MEAFPPYSGFHRTSHLASGNLGQVVAAVKSLFSDAHADGALIFDNATGRVVDVDFRGAAADVLARLPTETGMQTEPAVEAPRGPGRPKLGVVAKEVTLLPRHWEWLAAQPGGASVALRKLVEDARRANAGKDQVRQAQDRTYRFISAMLADSPALEEAQRALFSGQRALFEQYSAAWPLDLRGHALLLARDAFAEGEPA